MRSGTKLGILCAVGAAAVVCGAVVFFAGSDVSAPDVNEATPQVTAEFLASQEFTGMGKGEKGEFVEKVSETYPDAPVLTLLSNSNLSEEQRNRLMANIMPVIAPVITRRLDEFESMSPKEQEARLDGIIDRIEEYRKANPQETYSPERFNLMLQFVDPHTRARLRKHIPEMRERMEQRGIPTGDRPF